MTDYCAEGSVAVLAGVTHDNDTPCLLLDTLTSHGNTRTAIGLTERAFALQRLKGRGCVGYYDLASLSFLPCPDSAHPEAGRNACSRCEKRTGFTPAFDRFDRSSLSSQQLSYCNAPHVVYIAYFGGELTKVGISHIDRYKVRWTDQGALAATVVATLPDAWKARELEKTISRVADIPERVTTGKKIFLLERYWTTSVAAPQEVLGRTRYLLQRTHGLPIESHSVIDLRPHYASSEMTKLRVRAGTLVPPLALSSPFHGAIGNLALMAWNDEVLALDLSPFIGHKLKLIPANDAIVKLAPRQEGLFH